MSAFGHAASAVILFHAPYASHYASFSDAAMPPRLPMAAHSIGATSTMSHELPTQERPPPRRCRLPSSTNITLNAYRRRWS